MPNESKDTYITGEKSLTADQARELIDHTEDQYNEMLLRVALGTGMRRADLVGIEWNDVDLEERRIRYFEQKKSSNHTVYIRNKLKSGLKRWKKTQKRVFDGLPRHLFPAKRGEKKHRNNVSPKYAYDTLQRVARRAGIIDDEENLPVHALRATYVKREIDRLEQDFNSRAKAIDFVAKQINDDPSTLRRHYAVPSSNELRQAFQ